MHVMRAEKGYILVGQETDGSVTPVDIGLGALLAQDKDCLGRRSLGRSDTARRDRKQLVGLLPDNPGDVIPEGAQLVAVLGDLPPAMPGPHPGIIGHVTSSYFGARIGRSFALALVQNGRTRHGERVWAPLPDHTIAARICPPVFYDPEGARPPTAAARSPICRPAASSSRSPGKRPGRSWRRAAASTCTRAPSHRDAARRRCSRNCRSSSTR